MISRALSRGSQLVRSCQSRDLLLHGPRRFPFTAIIVRPSTIPRRTYVSKSIADEKIEEIQELYATAKDEFEIASEETEKKTVYAADDRAAAQEELAKLKTAFADATRGEGGEEIQRRIGGRLRELERALENLEERALEE